jgi:hypothetical protein
MDVAPAAAEAAVVTGAMVEAACVQQYAAAAAWVRQQAACMCAAAGGSGQRNDRNGRQAASVRVAAGSGCGVHAAVGSGFSVRATACSGSGVCTAASGSGRQHDCNGRQHQKQSYVPYYLSIVFFLSLKYAFGIISMFFTLVRCSIILSRIFLTYLHPCFLPYVQIC